MLPFSAGKTIWDELPETNIDVQKLEHLFESRAKDLISKVRICHFCHFGLVLGIYVFKIELTLTSFYELSRCFSLLIVRTFLNIHSFCS